MMTFYLWADGSGKPIMRNETAWVRTIPKSGGWVAMLGVLLILTASMTACDRPPLVKELVFSSWGEYVPQAAFDAFEREFGVKVTLVTYGPV